MNMIEIDEEKIDADIRKWATTTPPKTYGKIVKLWGGIKEKYHAQTLTPVEFEQFKIMVINMSIEGAAEFLVGMIYCSNRMQARSLL